MNRKTLLCLSIFSIVTTNLLNAGTGYEFGQQTRESFQQTLKAAVSATAFEKPEGLATDSLAEAENHWVLVLVKVRGRKLLLPVYRGDLAQLGVTSQSGVTYQAWFLLSEPGVENSRSDDFASQPLFSTWPPGRVPIDVRVQGKGFSILLFDIAEGRVDQVLLDLEGVPREQGPIQMVTQPEDMPEPAGGG